jgi:hypothetical protein
MPTFEIIIYIGYRSTSLTNWSLWMSRAAMEGLGIGARDGLQRVLLQSRSQSSVAENDGTFSQHTRKMASCYGGYTKDQQTVIVLRISSPNCYITVADTQSQNL